MDFKEQLEHDIDNTFFNSDEFAEEHLINGETISVIMLDNTLKENQKYTEEGLIQGDFVYTVKKDCIDEPQPGEFQNFDQYPCVIADCSSLNLVYKVILQINRGS